jgi:hypothetical protein
MDKTSNEAARVTSRAQAAGLRLAIAGCTTVFQMDQREAIIVIDQR